MPTDAETTTSDSEPPLPDAPCLTCGERAWRFEETIPWETGDPQLNETFETRVHVCRECDSKRWETVRLGPTLDAYTE